MKIVQNKYGNVEHYYKNYYRRVVGSEVTSIFRYLSSYPHKLMEKTFKSNSQYLILEIGSGFNEHFAHVKNNFKSYTGIDLFKPPKKNEVNDYRFKFKIMDAHKLKFRNNYFDRVITSCLLLHLRDPEKALKEFRRVTKKDGYLTFYISTDPSLFLRFFRKLTTAKKASKLGFFGYDLFIARDHKNSIVNILTLIKWIFKDDKLKIRYRPFFFRSWYLNGVCVVQIQKKST